MNRSVLRDRAVLVVAILLPTFITLLYFVWLAKSAAVIYGPLKALQFALPVVYVYLVRRGKQTPWPAPRYRPSVFVGLAFGLVVFVAGLAVYFLGLKPGGFFAGTVDEIHQKVADVGLNSPTLFLACSVFYSLVHSSLEEYYWRWFVFRECRAHWRSGPAILLSSAGFMLHHVFVLAEYFHWDSPYTYLFSLSVAVGGAVWAWLYEKYGTLLGPWLSHAVVDALIFAIGYDLVFRY